MNIPTIFQKQKEYFNTNETKNVKFRIAQLKKLKQVLKKNEALMYEAIYKDFSKSEFETYATELGIVYHEIDTFIKHIRTWSRKKRVGTDLANFPGRSYIIPEPLGVCLVIGAWNYPYQISLLPAITALAAGNTVILKPSELPSQTSKMMAQMINSNFPAEYFRVVVGEVSVTTQLLDLNFDKIFFTGSTQVGKIVYQAAAKHLTPVTLELGGKSPTFVLADADLKMAAKRIAWSKFLNAGQTCVAPDYILVEKSIEDKFLSILKTEIENNYSQEKVEENYLQIINDAHFDRLNRLLEVASDAGCVFYGGNTDKSNRFISPTLIHNNSFKDEIMQDEIFGPLLPIISFRQLDDIIQKVKDRPKPLSCYIYGKDRKNINKILKELSFGGGCINDSVMHFTNSKLPFGGVGSSGMGSYHGRSGFNTFSNMKSILDKPVWLETSLKYAPYKSWKFKIVRWLLG